MCKNSLFSPLSSKKYSNGNRIHFQKGLFLHTFLIALSLILAYIIAISNTLSLHLKTESKRTRYTQCKLVAYSGIHVIKSNDYVIQETSLEPSLNDMITSPTFFTLSITDNYTLTIVKGSTSYYLLANYKNEIFYGLIATLNNDTITHVQQWHPNT